MHIVLSDIKKIVGIVVFLCLFTFISVGQITIKQFLDESLPDKVAYGMSKKIDWKFSGTTLDSLNLALDKAIRLGISINDNKNVHTLKLYKVEFSDDDFNNKLEELQAIKKEAIKNNWDSINLASQYRIARVYESRNEIQKTFDILDKLISENESTLKNYGKLHAIVLEELGHTYSIMGDIENEILYFQKALAINSNRKDSISMSANYLNIAGSYFSMRNLSKAKEYNRKGLRLAQKSGIQKYQMNANLNLASIYGFSEQFDSCLLYAMNSNSIAEQNYFLRGQAFSSDIIAACYVNLDKPKKALTYQIEAYRLVNDIYAKNRMALNVGLNYIELKDFENAEKYYDTAYQLARVGDAQFELLNIWMHYGFLYQKTKKPNKALINFNKALNGLEKEQDPYLYSEINRGLGLVYNELSEYKKSNDYFEEAISYQSDFSNLAEIYLKQANNFQELGKLNDAIEAYKNHITFKDSLEKKSNKKLEQSILAQFAVEKAEAKANLALKNKEIAELSATKQKRLKLFGFILFGLSILSIFLIVNRHRSYRKERERTAKLEKEASQAIINHSREILTNQGSLIIEKNRIIDELKSNLDLFFEDVKTGKSKVEDFLNTRILTNEDWDKFKVSFEVVYPGFIDKCNLKFPKLTSNELRLLCLYKLGMNKKEVAEMLAVLPSSVKRSTNRFYQKYNIGNSTDMSEIAKSIV